LNIISYLLSDSAGIYVPVGSPDPTGNFVPRVDKNCSPHPLLFPSLSKRGDRGEFKNLFCIRIISEHRAPDLLNFIILSHKNKDSGCPIK